MTDARTLRIGTRGSPLALAQAHFVAGELSRLTAGKWQGEICTYTTSGDQLTTQRLTEAGGKGLFTREIDRAVDAGEVDIAVHSLKDVPALLPAGQVFVAFPPREDPREAFLSLRARHPGELEPGARVGTASLRREAQTRAMRPDLQIVTFRGNVQTRLRKLETGEADATYLALAGLNRLGLAHLATSILDPSDFLPAPCQGIIGVVAREGALHPEVAAAMAALDHPASRQAATAERAFLARLDGSCRTPIAAHLSQATHGLVLRGEVYSPDGRERWAGEAHCSAHAEPEALRALGAGVAEAILAQAGGQLPAFA